MGSRTLTLTKAEKALRANHGVILSAAKACGVARFTFYRFMQEHPELYDVKAEAEEEIIDVAEGIMVDNLRNGDMKTIRWFLDRKAKNRGYSTRVETTGANGGPIEQDVTNNHSFNDLADILEESARTRAGDSGDASAVAEDGPSEPTPTD